jgi:hypothetical protein
VIFNKLIESLLAEPKNKRADPADRLADIVACSFPRAELTDLAYAPGLAVDFEGARENRDKARAVASAILDGSCAAPRDWKDRAALERMRALLDDPGPSLRRIKIHVRDALARLYRQRNLVLHAGNTRAVALQSTLRGATPLVGAGLDRIYHARFVDGTQPIALAGRARTALETLTVDRVMECVSLIGN